MHLYVITLWPWLKQLAADLVNGGMDLHGLALEISITHNKSNFQHMYENAISLKNFN